MDLHSTNGNGNNGNGNGNGTHHTLPADSLDPLVTLSAPLSEVQAFVKALSNEWMPYNARVFFDRLATAAEPVPAAR